LPTPFQTSWTTVLAGWLGRHALYTPNRFYPTGDQAMNCFDCAALGRSAHAVATCADCGAAMCIDHSHVTARWLTRIVPISRPVRVGPPARTIRCHICQAARDAAPDATYAETGLLQADRRP
jgi:hypothetical protein